jgi:Tfp pilus assembly protein PilO
VKSLDTTKAAIGGLVAAGLLVLVAGYLMVISPQSSKASALDADIASKQAQVDALHGPRANDKSLHANELFQLSRAMPTNDDQPGVLLELSRLAGASSVQLAAVAFQPRVALTDGSSAVPVRVTIDGSWAQFATFLRLVDNEVRANRAGFSIGGRLFTTDTIQIQPAASGGTIEAVLQMAAFDYGAPPSPTATAGGTSTTSTTTTTTTTTATTSGSQQAAGGTSGSS